MQDSAGLVAHLARRLAAEVIETHISWVLLTDGLAFKLKKPVRLPFVDYSTPERRRHFCAEEVRLNRRLAPSLYLGVSEITGTIESPEIDGGGPVLDHAVRMRRFPPGALFSELLAEDLLDADAVDRFAALLAGFHAHAPVAKPGPHEDAARHRDQALAALAGAREVLPPGSETALGAWLVAQSTLLEPLWTARRARGRVRECHGDLHLANVVALGGEVAAFDCIEFDPALRWIDVLDDAAFALMDFCARGRPDLGWRFFNGWLERAGDHDALPALRFSVVARALVRAQVEHLRAPRCEAARRYAQLAFDWSHGRTAHLFITHGLPGSGKTFASQRLLEQQGAIRLRSDVERKRLFGLQALEQSQAQGLDLYTADATRRTYDRLYDVAGSALRAGLPVVLDAAFLKRSERSEAHAVATRLGVPFSIVACKAPLPVLRERLRQRHGDASEADVAVLEKLRASAEPLAGDELAFLSGASGTPPPP